MLENYKGGHRKFPVAQEIVDSYVADYKKAHPWVQYQVSLGYEEGKTNAYTWAQHEYLLNGVDMKRLDSAIAKIFLHGYDGYRKSARNEYIVEVGSRADYGDAGNNKLVFVSGDFEFPVITRIVVLDDRSEAYMSRAKAVIYDEAERTGRLHESEQAIQLIYGEGYADFRVVPNHLADARETLARARENRKRNSRTTRKGKRQYQVNRDTASDMDLLMGASMLPAVFSQNTKGSIVSDEWKGAVFSAMKAIETRTPEMTMPHADRAQTCRYCMRHDSLFPWTRPLPLYQCGTVVAFPHNKQEAMANAMASRMSTKHNWSFLVN